MFRKLFVFIMLSTLAGVAVSAQDSPKTIENKDKEALAFVFSGSRSYIGVEIKEITKSNFAEMGLSEVRGVGVARVLKDSPADKAGLVVRDVIILFNGEVLTSRRQLTRLIAEIAPDHKANLTVLRNGTEVEIPMIIGKRPTPALLAGNSDFPKMNVPSGQLPEVETITPRGNGQNAVVWRMSSGRSIGVGVTPLTKQLANHFGVKDGKGLLVNRVSKDSPAEKAGLKAGDVIVEIDGKKATRTNDLIRSIYEKKDGKLNLTIIRDKNRQTLTLTLTPETRKSSPIKITEDPS